MISRPTKCSTRCRPQSEFDLLGPVSGCRTAASKQPGHRADAQHDLVYRRPILDYWAEHDETLGHIVRHVLIHEIGHHFGLSDADMEAIEEAAG